MATTKKQVKAVVRRTVPNDHSCLYTSFAYLAEGPKINANAFTRAKAAGALRSLYAKTIKENPDDWPEWKIGRSVEAYTKFVLDTTSWGGEIEIAILTSHYGCPVWVASMLPGTVLKYAPGTLKGDKDKGFLLFYTGQHYEPVVGVGSLEGSLPEDDVSVADLSSETERLLVELCTRERAAAAKRAQEVRVKKIKCLDCGALLDTSSAFQEHCMDDTIEHSEDFCYECEEVVVIMTKKEVAAKSTVDLSSPTVHTFYDTEAVPLANCYPSPITIDGVSFLSVYHYLLWAQFDVKSAEGKKIADQVLKATEWEQLRQLEGMVGSCHPGVREDWESMKEKAALAAMRAKFTQNAKAAAVLLETGDKHIVMVGSDKWGGMTAAAGLPEGMNVYGKSLMKIRGELKQS